MPDARIDCRGAACEADTLSTELLGIDKWLVCVSGPFHVQGCEKQDKNLVMGTARSLVLDLVFIRALFLAS